MESNLNLNLAVVPNDFLERIENRLNVLESLLQSGSKSHPSEEYIDSTSAKEMLGICQRTLQEYRDRRIIGFHQVGRKIMYRRSDIEKFLDEHYIVRSL
jgi:hypothetical protein